MNKEAMFQQVIDHWNNNMPFNELLGFKITEFNAQKSEVRFDWQK